MKKIITVGLLLLLVSLSGCALTEQQAYGLTDYELCQKASNLFAAPRTKGVAYDELRRRSQDCSAFGADLNHQSETDKAMFELYMKTLLGF
tara:strand:- start:471 stop:743 length:273 start_codon:yes stop_codon:yes gene_type:complete